MAFFFFAYSWSPLIVVSRQSSALVSSLLQSFHGAYSMSTAFLECQALRIHICYFLLWSLSQSSPLVHFKNGPEILTQRTSYVFISLVRFLLQSFVLRSFQVLLIYSLIMFFFKSLFVLWYLILMRLGICGVIFFSLWLFNT